MDANGQRLTRARRLADVYVRHSDIRAVILGGSVARDAASVDSDIDLGMFWSVIPPQETLEELLQRAGGVLDRRVDNRDRYEAGSPRRQGCIEIAALGPTADLPQVRVDLEHETVIGTEAVLDQVLNQGDLSLEKQELLSVLQTGVILYGDAVANTWRAKAEAYPDELVCGMVGRYCVGIGELLLHQVRWIQTGDWFCFYGGLLDVSRRLLLTLMGLNRTWVFTDNSNLKGWGVVAEGLRWRPIHIVDRLGASLQSNAQVAVDGLASLSEEVIDLVETHLPTTDLSADRASLERVRRAL